MNDDLEKRTLRKVSLRLVPFLGLLYFAAFLDRVNVAFAADQMTRDLSLTKYAYGLGAGIFFIGYCLFEVPSNLALHRVGARRWIARIMITWSVVAAAMACVKGPTGFYALRFLLGVAEAGFFPGIVYYLTHWVPASSRARLVGAFMTAVPISTAIGGPLSSELLRLDGAFGLAGWQWLFLVEALPSFVLGLVTLRYLRDDPATAKWLDDDERSWLVQSLKAERAAAQSQDRMTVFQALTSRRVLSLGLCYFGAQIGLYGVILWVPQILVSTGFDAATVGYVVAIPYATAAVGMVWWARRSDRLQERTWHLVAAACAGVVGLVMSTIVIGSKPLVVVAVALGATGTLAALPIFWTLPGARLQGAPAAGAIALINSLGNVGGFTGPFLIGWVKTVTGSYTWGLLAAALGLVSTAVIAVSITRAKPAESATPPSRG